MQEPVTEVLARRSQVPRGPEGPMLAVSFGAHATLLAALVIVPLFMPHKPAPIMMTISLGGVEGPKVEGTTSAGGRPVDEAVPQPRHEAPIPLATAKPEPTPPPPPDVKTTVMPKVTTPAKTVAPPPPAPDPLRYYSAIHDAPVSPKPVTGAVAKTGNTPRDTGVQGIGTGLASGGGTSGVKLDDPDFCCNEYVTAFVARIKEHWQDSPTRANGIVKFTIQKDGTITNISVEKSSGVEDLDLGMQRALFLTKKLPPLPKEFTDPSLTVHLTVVYGGS